MTPNDGPILIAFFLVAGILLTAGTLYVRRSKKRQKSGLTLNYYDGGTPIIPDGKTVRIGTPGDRNREEAPIISPLGRKVLRTHFAAQRLDEVASIGTSQEIQEAGAECWAAAAALARHIHEGQRESQERGQAPPAGGN